MAEVVQKRIAEIKANQNFTEEQKMQMIGRLMLESEQQQEYVRETEKQQVSSQDKQQNEQNQNVFDDWVPNYQQYFKPTFTSTGLPDTFTIKDGTLTVRVRKLKLGDYMKLAALIPKWKNHLLGEEPLNMQQIDIFTLIATLIVNAMEDWDFKHNCPSGFTLSVLSTIREFLANPQDISINDMLDSDPDELIELAMGIYGNNLRFFTKISSRFGILQDLKGLYSGILSTLRSALRKGAESLSSKKSGEEIVDQEILSNQITKLNGGLLDGGMKHSSSRSAKARKGS